MDKPQWFELRNLPDEVEAGDRDAIAQWLAKWSRERKVEAMVWIDLKEIPVKVMAGTSLEEEQVSVPDELPRRFNDPDEQLEIWHDHPEAGGPSTAVPQPFDVATAMRRGVAAVGTVDDSGRYIVIGAGDKATRNRSAARDWIRRAAVTERFVLDNEAWDETDREGAVYRHIIALGVAYEQNDTEARKLHVVLQRNPGEAAHGSAEVLASRLGEIERKLKGRPKNAFLRTQRAAILCSLARRDAASVRRARGRAAAIAPSPGSNSLRKAASASRTPVSVRTTDLALLTGSEISPFS